MPSLIIRNIVDAFVFKDSPKQNWNSVTKSHFGVNNDFQTFMFWSMSIPKKANIISAFLCYRAAAAMGAGGQITFDLVNASWSATRINYDNRPIGQSGSQVTWTTPVAIEPGDLVRVPITSLIQSVSNGAKWWGLRLYSASATRRTMWSAQAKQDLRPYVEISWSEAPKPPANLIPRAGQRVSRSDPLLNWDFIDYLGDVTQGKFRVQISTNAAFSAIVHDSGELDSAASEYNLANSAWDATANVTYYWRVKVWDGTGYESLWSPTESFIYTPLGTVTIINPADAYVEDTSPIIEWSFTGSQTAFFIRVRDKATNALLFDSGRIAGAQTDYTLPTVITRQGVTYAIYVYVYDNQNRIFISGAADYATGYKEIVLQLNPTVTPVTDLDLLQNPNSPIMTLQWKRTTLPDNFRVYYQGALIETLDPLDVQVNGNPDLFRMTHIPQGRENATYVVYAVVNGKMSPATSRTEAIRRTYTWLTDVSYGNAVPLLNVVVDVQEREMAQIVEPLAGKAWLVMQDGVTGKSGSIEGELTSIQGTTLNGMLLKARVEAIWKNLGGRAKLTHSSMTLDVYIYGVKFTEKPQPNGGVDFGFSCSFVEV